MTARDKNGRFRREIPIDFDDFYGMPLAAPILGAVEKTYCPPGALQTWVVWPDCHCPFEDKAAFNLVQRVETALKPYGRVFLGDFADMLSTSRHPKTPPQARWQLKDEVEYVNMRLDQFPRLARQIWTLGNHDTNGQRFAAREKLGLYDSLDPRHLFHLKERGWEVYDYQVPVRVGKVWFVHDTDYSGPNAAKQNGDMFQASTVQGHCHNAQVLYSGSAMGDRHVSATVGWLGDPQAAAYMASIKKTRNWQHAFGVLRVEPNGNSHFQLVPIIEGACVVDGILYRQ